MKAHVKASMKVQRIAGALSRVSIQNVNHLQVYFCGIRPSLTLFLKEKCGTTFLTPVCVHRKYHFSMYFLRRVISHFLPKKKNIYFREKIPSFQTIQGGSCPSATLFEKTIFSESLKKIYFRVFFLEESSFIFHLRCKMIFSGKGNIIFPEKDLVPA